MNREILVIVERLDGRIIPAAREVIVFARRLAAEVCAKTRIVLLGFDLQQEALKLAQETALDVLALEDGTLEPYNAESWMTALSSLPAVQESGYICFSHTSRGCDLAPGLAVRLGAGCITAVEGFHKQEGVVGFTRSLFNGKIGMTVAPTTDRVVLTVMPGMFDEQPGPFKKSASPGRVQHLAVTVCMQRIRSMGVLAAPEQDLDLDSADVIVSVGRGIGSEENLEWIWRLTNLFQKSAVGCSRAPFEMGWLRHRHQVGLTGKTVAPKLYLACGISGAVQHISGMRGARFVVAVNKDPQAAIFRVADVGIVEDLAVFIPLLLRKAEDSEKSERNRCH